jgi:DNA-binding Lrp family transcriptional regulator
MAAELTDLQKRLCDILQAGLTVCPRPFAEIAELLDVDEDDVLAETAALRKAGIIKRIGPVLDYRALGKVSALITAHVEAGAIDKVAHAVNSLSGVSHNYLRDHNYNLWFTLQADSPSALDEIVNSLSTSLGIEFHILPAVRFFKLDVRFNLSDMSRDEQVLVSQPPKPPVILDAARKEVLSWLQDGIDITAEPFSGSRKDTIEIIKGLMACGVIKRIAATVDYRRLGFIANAMFCCKVDAARTGDVGSLLAALGEVSHCYERRTFPGWPYNLFAMMHARNMDKLNETVAGFLRESGITDYVLLPTTMELKKSSVRHTFST